MCLRAKSCCCGLASLESGAKFIALAGLVCATLGFFYSYYCEGVLSRFPHEEAIANFLPEGPTGYETKLARRIHMGLFLSEDEIDFTYVKPTLEEGYYYDISRHYWLAKKNYKIAHPKMGIAANIAMGIL